VTVVEPGNGSKADADIGDRRSPRHTILASNRGPVQYRITPGGELEIGRGAGGVATALTGLACDTDVTWIASAMSEGDRRIARETMGQSFAPLKDHPQCRLRFLAHSRRSYHLYYNVLSNPILWLVQHGMADHLERPNLQFEAMDAWRKGYDPVNRAFADAVIEELDRVGGTPFVMLQDYHLYLAPLYIRAARPGAILQQFVHVPWPAPQAWHALPWEIVESICRGALANSIVGFQTKVAARNFALTCQTFLRGAEVGYNGSLIRYDGNETWVRTYPISVNVDTLRQQITSPEVRSHKRRLSGLVGERTILRVDRVDLSKNIVAGFRAFDRLLRRHPRLIGKVRFLALLVPSRTSIPEYQKLRQEIDEAAAEVNRRHSRRDWQPIVIIYGNNYSRALAAMSLYDVLLVNPLADGMNLVSKEGPIVNERDGVLVLSSQAGAHEELAPGALSVQPEDVEGTAETLWHALNLPAEERRVMARYLCWTIERRDLRFWLNSQVEDLESAGRARSRQVSHMATFKIA
jgi:trehalose 6-phosphate synthase